MDEVLQHLEAALASVEAHLTESALFQDIKNRLEDVRNHAVSAKDSLVQSVASANDSAAQQPNPPQQPEQPSEQSAPQPPAPQEGAPVGPPEDPQSGNAQQETPVTDEQGNPVSDPNAAR